MAAIEGGNPRGAEIIKLNNVPNKVEELKSMVKRTTRN